MSSTIASSILRKFSACRSSLDENGMALILVTPSTTCATSGPNSSLMRSMRGQRVLDDVVEQAGGDRDDVELHVGQEVGDLERVDQVGLARMAHLSLVLERREDVGPPQQLEVGVRAVGPDLLEQILEANHGNRCLSHVCAMDIPIIEHSGIAARRSARRLLDLRFWRSIYWRGSGEGAPCAGPPATSSGKPHRTSFHEFTRGSRGH